MKALTRNWLAKLGSLLFAILIWYFVSTSQNTQASSEYSVPVVYDGLQKDQVVRGAPANVLVKVIGFRDQLSRLSAENFSAVIDFNNTEGSYEKDILVVQPQGITVVSVTPATALGTVESIEQVTVPVETSLLGQVPEDMKVSLTTSLSEAKVLGISSSLKEVAKVIASIPVREGDQQISLFAANADNVPIRDSTITVSPSSITVSLSYEAILYTRQVPINLEDVLDMFESATIGLSNVALSQTSLTLIGPKDVLSTINSVNVSVEPITSEITTGTYTLKVTPILPRTVTTTDIVTLELSLVVLPEPTEELPDGENNDSARTSIWRSDLKETRFAGQVLRQQT